MKLISSSKSNILIKEDYIMQLHLFLLHSIKNSFFLAKKTRTMLLQLHAMDPRVPTSDNRTGLTIVTLYCLYMV